MKVTCRTVKVKKKGGGFSIINESDFVEGKHELAEAKAAAPKAAVPTPKAETKLVEEKKPEAKTTPWKKN